MCVFTVGACICVHACESVLGTSDLGIRFLVLGWGGGGKQGSILKPKSECNKNGRHAWIHLLNVSGMCTTKHTEPYLPTRDHLTKT